MAPEVMEGHDYGYKVDVWSLGTLTYQLLTGKHPFNGRDMKDLKRNLDAGDYRIPSELNLSGEAISFLNDCLRSNCHERLSFTSI